MGLDADAFDPVVLAENCQINEIDDAMDDLRFLNLMPMFTEALEDSNVPPVSGDLARRFGLADTQQIHTALGDSRTIVNALRHIQSLR